MLLNLSNHPSQNWDKIQIKAAINAYGQIKDIPFPGIDPEWNIKKIDSLAKEYSSKIQIELLSCPANSFAVHLMGETAFCFSLANILKRKKINCVCSTTRRNAVENNGVKTSIFEFVQFRNYFNL